MLPIEVPASFIARSDVSTELRECFYKRGVPAGATPAPDTEEPLLDTDEPGLGLDNIEGTEEEKQLTFQQRLSNMTVLMQRLNESDVKKLSTDRNVVEALRVAAKKRLGAKKH